ncbi:MAG: hypothetical protein IT557_18665 [Alphaproteobacteria bacterium]|nr:hypothetical protein [Alphaproteobacteria bacterium]
MSKTFLPTMAAAFLVLGLAACAELTGPAPGTPAAGSSSPNYASDGGGQASNVCERDRNACLAN